MKSIRQEVSIYVPCYNAQATIRECLESIIRQSYKIKEVLVIDDGSTDSSAEISGLYPVRIIKNSRNMGLAYCRNLAFGKLDADLIASLDADCAAAPLWLERLCRTINDFEASGAGGRLIEFSTERIADRWRKRHMSQDWGDLLVKNPPFLYGSNTVFIKKSVMSCGGYDLRLSNNGEDVGISRGMYKNGFLLIYNPEACVMHLRRDSAVSVLRNYYKWLRPAFIFDLLDGQRYSSAYQMLVISLKVFPRHALLLLRLFFNDCQEKKFSFAALDIFCCLIFIWQDCKSFARKTLSLIFPNQTNEKYNY
jgi:glycosyltransferase involved in cell wall biosynthesis